MCANKKTRKYSLLLERVPWSKMIREISVQMEVTHFIYIYFSFEICRGLTLDKCQYIKSAYVPGAD